jgi:hypothetical protein
MLQFFNCRAMLNNRRAQHPKLIFQKSKSDAIRRVAVPSGLIEIRIRESVRNLVCGAGLAITL